MQLYVERGTESPLQSEQHPHTSPVGYIHLMSTGWFGNVILSCCEILRPKEDFRSSRLKVSKRSCHHLRSQRALQHCLSQGSNSSHRVLLPAHPSLPLQKGAGGFVFCQDTRTLLPSAQKHETFNQVLAEPATVSLGRGAPATSVMKKIKGRRGRGRNPRCCPVERIQIPCTKPH